MTGHVGLGEVEIVTRSTGKNWVTMCWALCSGNQVLAEMVFPQVVLSKIFLDSFFFSDHFSPMSGTAHRGPSTAHLKPWTAHCGPWAHHLGMDHGLPTLGCGLPTVGCGLPTVGRGRATVWAVGCPPWAVGYPLWAMGCPPWAGWGQNVRIFIARGGLSTR